MDPTNYEWRRLTPGQVASDGRRVILGAEYELRDNASECWGRIVYSTVSGYKFTARVGPDTVSGSRSTLTEAQAAVLGYMVRR